MGRIKQNNSGTTVRMGRPAMTPEARQNQLISLAYDRAEEQLRSGTASSQVITHFLKLGTAREELELEKLKQENKLLESKTEAMKAAQRMEEVYSKVIDAMKTYSGTQSVDEDEDEDEDYDEEDYDDYDERDDY